MKVYDTSDFSFACDPGIANDHIKTTGVLYFYFIALFTLKRLAINIGNHFEGWDSPAITVADGNYVNEDAA